MFLHNQSKKLSTLLITRKLNNSFQPHLSFCLKRLIQMTLNPLLHRPQPNTTLLNHPLNALQQWIFHPPHLLHAMLHIRRDHPLCTAIALAHGMIEAVLKIVNFLLCGIGGCLVGDLTLVGACWSSVQWILCNRFCWFWWWYGVVMVMVVYVAGGRDFVLVNVHAIRFIYEKLVQIWHSQTLSVKSLQFTHYHEYQCTTWITYHSKKQCTNAYIPPHRSQFETFDFVHDLGDWWGHPRF